MVFYNEIVCVIGNVVINLVSGVDFVIVGKMKFVVEELLFYKGKFLVVFGFNNKGE